MCLREQPPPEFSEQDGNGVGSGRRSGPEISPPPPEHCGRGSAGPSCSNVAVNAINMFVAGPAPLKGEKQTMEP